MPELPIRQCPLCSGYHEGCRFAAGSLWCVKPECANPHHRRLSLMRKITSLLALVLLLTLTACSGWNASHDYNAPTPVRTWQPAGGWIRIETPGNWPSEIFACHGTDGIYASMDNSSSAFVVRDDPNCHGGKS